MAWVLVGVMEVGVGTRLELVECTEAPVLISTVGRHAFHCQIKSVI